MGSWPLEASLGPPGVGRSLPEVPYSAQLAAEGPFLVPSELPWPEDTVGLGPTGGEP